MDSGSSGDEVEAQQRLLQENISHEEAAMSLLKMAIVEEDALNYRLDLIASIIYKHATFQKRKLIVYTVAGPDTGKTSLDMAESEAFSAYVKFITMKGRGGGLNDRSVFNAEERLLKVAEARGTNALLEMIKDGFCCITNSATRGYTSDSLTTTTKTISKCNMSSNYEDMFPEPGADIRDKIVLYLEFDTRGNRILGKFVSNLGDEAAPGYFEKDSSASEKFASPEMKSAIARLYLKRARGNGVDAFDPDVLPPSMQGLKEKWSLVQGMDSLTVLEKVPGKGYETLRGLDKATRVCPLEIASAQVVVAPSSVDDFETPADMLSALVKEVAKLVVLDVPDSFTTPLVCALHTPCHCATFCGSECLNPLVPNHRTPVTGVR
eukprot:5150351-Prymnesium_polylepis.1